MASARVPVPGSVEAMVVGRQMRLPGQPPPSKRSQGKRAQSIGEVAERVVMAAHSACVFAKLATQLRHGDSGLRPAGAPLNGKIPCVPKGTGDIDFRASLRLPGGVARPICLEVKHTDTDPPRLSFGQIEDHQAAIMSEETQAGSLCLLMVVGARGELWTVPWEKVAPLREVWQRASRSGLAAQASLLADDLAPWKALPGQPYLARFVRAS